MHPSLRETGHRPWPMPDLPWTWTQSWHDLLFAHWPLSAADLRPLIPAGLEIEEFDGSAWIGVVPFWMRIRHRYLPPMPGVSQFAEINVRIYVRRDGKRGVWFFSLDATKTLAVKAARRFFHLPYFRADITTQADGEWIEYHSSRRRESAEFAGRYRPTSEVWQSQPGSLAHWLTERYCLFAEQPDGKLVCGDIHHAPWELQEAEAQIETMTMLEPLGLVTPDIAPVLHFARYIDTVLWPLQGL